MTGFRATSNLEQAVDGSNGTYGAAEDQLSMGIALNRPRRERRLEPARTDAAACEWAGGMLMECRASDAFPVAVCFPTPA